jgi:hypothetical protein
MLDSQPTGVLGFTAYGVEGAISADRPEVLERARVCLPPAWEDGPPAPAKGRFSITAGGQGFEVSRDDVTRVVTPDLEIALNVLDAEVRAHVALRAPERVFVHAGVVAHAGGTIVIPGASFSGKTTLVAELIQAGATYYSDEFAVLDPDGRVHPYPKPLSIRNGERWGVDHPAESLGATIGMEPLPAALIAVTSYRPGARWAPERRSAGDGAMALLANTVPVRERPREALAAVSRAAADAVVLEGERGDAGATAAALLREVVADR